MSLGDSGLRVYGRKIAVGGRRFWDCSTIAEIAERCAKPIDFGSDVRIPDEMYPFWRSLLERKPVAQGPEIQPPGREWKEAVESLQTYPYDHSRLRTDLAPAVKAAFALRYLDELSARPTKAVAEAISNLATDSGEALVWLQGHPKEWQRLVHAISEAQDKLAAKRLKARDVVVWWSWVCQQAKGLDDRHKGRIVAELRSLLANSPVDATRRAALFALASLKIPDFDQVKVAAMSSNNGWAASRSLKDLLRYVAI